jgi:hypothetical protein
VRVKTQKIAVLMVNGRRKEFVCRRRSVSQQLGSDIGLFLPRRHDVVVREKNLTAITGYGPGSVVGIATSYGLDGPGIECRWGKRFSAPVETGPGAHTACCTMGTRSFPGVKSGRGMTLATHPLLEPLVMKE